MLVKGQLMEKWNKQIFWIMQRYVFENMVSRFKLENMNFNDADYTKYFIYDLIEKDNIYQLNLVEKKSSTISNLLKAFTHQNKIELKVGLSLK